MEDYNLTCFVVSSAAFVDMEADFHARVPVVICKERKRWVCPVATQLVDYFKDKLMSQTLI